MRFIKPSVEIRRWHFADRFIIDVTMRYVVCILRIVQKFVSSDQLRPKWLATQVRSIDERAPDRRVTPECPQSTELGPVEEPLNSISVRPEAASRREQRLCADFAHEERMRLAKIQSPV